MISHCKKVKKSWFTLLEIVIACSLFAIIVVWILWAITRAYKFMNNTRVQVRATNLAREWVEMMFNLRDTNRRKHSWEKDVHRMYRWTWDTSNLLLEWLYALKEWKSDNDTYIYAEKLNVIDTESFYSEEGFWSDMDSWYRNNAKLTFTWTYSYASWTKNPDNTITWSLATWNVSDLLWWWVDFYRVLRVYGIYNKNSSTPTEKITSASDLKSSIPKELRFCVKVFYKSTEPHSTELCSIMTNFEE